MPFLHKKTGETKKLDFWRALPWVWLVLAYDYFLLGTL